MEDRKILSYPTAPERRKKVTQACDYCKRRKYKCIGKAPCELCKKKNIPCQFSIVDRRTTKGIKKRASPPSQPAIAPPSGSSHQKSPLAPHHPYENPPPHIPAASPFTINAPPFINGPSGAPTALNNSNTIPGGAPAPAVNTPRILHHYSPYQPSNSATNLYQYHHVPQQLEPRRLSIPQINPSSSHDSRNSDNKLPPASKLLRSTYIPKSLQPLLSFPLNNNNHHHHHHHQQHHQEEITLPAPALSPIRSTTEPAQVDVDVKMEPDSSEELSDDQSRVPRILFDSATSTRYIGESSPLSLLFEARNIFNKKLGDSEFSRDTSGINILDEPIQLKPGATVKLPSRDTCNKLLVFFQNNINQSWYIFNMEYFKSNTVDWVYNNPVAAANSEKLALVHLVVSLGLLFAEISRDPVVDEIDFGLSSISFFESGFNLTRNTVDDGKLWLTEAYFLIYFYYQSTCNRSTSWLMLGTAIRNAQALGLHRKFINESYKDKQYVSHRRKLWVSLYVCDRISSILLGRPLLIVDYDWDDFDNHNELIESEPGNAKNIMCLIEIAKVAVLNGKIVQNFYLNGTIDPTTAEKLAVEFKLWSINLHPDIQIDKILHWNASRKGPEVIPESVLQDNFSVFAVHLSQLYGIMLLSRPFFMYHAFRSSDNKSKSINPTDEATMVHFCRASVKSSVLTIQLINYYMQQFSGRVETYPSVNCCFMAVVTLGLSILHRKTSSGYADEYSTSMLMERLITGERILSLIGPISVTAQRFSIIVSKMKNTLLENFPDLSEPVSSVSSPESVAVHPTISEDHSDTSSMENYTPRSNEESNGTSAGIGKASPLPPTSSNNTPQSISTPPLGSIQPSQRPQPHPAQNSASSSSNGPADLESLLEFQRFFVPKTSANGFSSPSDERDPESSKSSKEKVGSISYNIGTSDILFDNNL